MLTSLALLFLTGLSLAAICQRLRLPRMIGMLAAGICLGPFALNLLDPALLNISAELRQMALVIILIKAGLSLNLSDLKRVGRPAVLLSFLPATFEVAACVLFAPRLLGLTRLEAALLGAVLGAVSPAVVVPKMVSLMEQRRGTGKGIPQMILAGASLDDVYVIVLFSTFLGMAQGGGVSLSAFAGVPVSIVLGLALGAAAGFLLNAFFTWRGSNLRSIFQTIIVLCCAFLLLTAEGLLAPYVPVSGLLAVTGMACMLRAKGSAPVSRRLGGQFGRLWLGAEVILFVLVGAAVDIRYTLAAGPAVVAVIALGLCLRSLGVLCCLIGTPLNLCERLFCVVAYLPKATVQAAIGSTALALGLSCGSIVLSAAVVAILLCAPLGAIGMELTSRRLLTGQRKP